MMRKRGVRGDSWSLSFEAGVTLQLRHLGMLHLSGTIGEDIRNKAVKGVVIRVVVVRCLADRLSLGCGG